MKTFVESAELNLLSLRHRIHTRTLIERSWNRYKDGRENFKQEN